MCGKALIGGNQSRPGRRCRASFTYRAGSSGWKSVWQITRGFGWCRSCFLQTWRPEYQSLAIRAAENIYRTNPPPSLDELRRVLLILWLWSCVISIINNICLWHTQTPGIHQSSGGRGKKNDVWEVAVSLTFHPVDSQAKYWRAAALRSQRGWPLTSTEEHQTSH